MSHHKSSYILIVITLLFIHLFSGCMETVDVEKICPNQRVCLVVPKDNNSHGVFVKNFAPFKENIESLEFHHKLIDFSTDYINSLGSYSPTLKLDFLSSVEGIPAYYDADHLREDKTSKNTYARVFLENFPKEIEIWTVPYNREKSKEFKYSLFFNEAKKEYEIAIDR